MNKKITLLLLFLIVKTTQCAHPSTKWPEWYDLNPTLLHSEDKPVTNGNTSTCVLLSLSIKDIQSDFAAALEEENESETYLQSSGGPIRTTQSIKKKYPLTNQPSFQLQTVDTDITHVSPHLFTGNPYPKVHPGPVAKTNKYKVTHSTPKPKTTYPNKLLLNQITEKIRTLDRKNKIENDNGSITCNCCNLTFSGNGKMLNIRHYNDHRVENTHLELCGIDPDDFDTYFKYTGKNLYSCTLCVEGYLKPARLERIRNHLISTVHNK